MICPHCKKPIMRGVTNEQKAEVLKLRALGYAYRDIEKLTGASTSAVGRILREADTTLPLEVRFEETFEQQQHRMSLNNGRRLKP